MMDDAILKIGSYALWSGGFAPSEAEHLASTIDGFPKRSSLMRDTGVFVDNIAAGDATLEALSSIEICIRSFGSRTRRTNVSIMVFESTLKEYWTFANGAEFGNSRRTRTQLAVELAPE